MFIWAILLLLFGASLGEIMDTENVTDSCSKGNKKLCGKNQSIRVRCFFVVTCYHRIFFHRQNFVIVT